MIAKFLLLESLPQKRQDEIIASLPILNLSKDTTVFERDEETKDIYFILSGSVKSVIFSKGGQQAYYKIIQAGEFFGFYSTVTNMARTANIITTEPTKLAKMTQSAFLDMVCDNPGVARYFLTVIGSLLRSETNRINNIITRKSKERLSHDLLVSQDINGIVTIPSRDEYASRLSMTRETLSRHLNNLKKEGLISLSKKRIIILKPEILKDKI